MIQQRSLCWYWRGLSPKHTAVPAPPVVETPELRLIWAVLWGRSKLQQKEIHDLRNKGLWKPHPGQPPTYEPTSWGDKFTAMLAALQRDFSPASELCQFSNTCCSGQASGPRLLPWLPLPASPRGEGTEWPSACTLVPGVGHKAMLFEYCPERGKLFLETEHRVWRPRTVCSTSRERCFLMYISVCWCTVWFYSNPSL